jgi:hypothetical protein
MLILIFFLSRNMFIIDATGEMPTACGINLQAAISAAAVVEHKNRGYCLTGLSSRHTAVHC